MKKILLALFLTGIVFVIGYVKIRQAFTSGINSGIAACEKEMMNDGSITNKGVFFKKISAEIPDFVFGIAFDKNGDPVVVGNVADQRVKDFLYNSRRLNDILVEFRRDSTKFFSAKEPLAIKSKEVGTFILRPLVVKNEKVLLVFSERRSELKLRTFTILNLLLFGLILMVVFRVRNRSGVGATEKIRSMPTVESLRESTVRKLFEEKKRLQKEVEDLGFFREIALATNSMTNLKSMLKFILDLLSMKFQGRDIVIYLGKDGSSEEFEPVMGILEGGLSGPQELETAGHVSLSDDDLTKALNEQESGTPYSKGTILPLKDDENQLGFILFGFGDEGKPPEMADLNFTARQLSMTIRNSVLYNMAITDGLTGLYVQRYFQMKMDEEIRRSIRYRNPFTLVMIDLDHFKNVNDTYGHQAGDRVLQGISALLKMHVRKTDFVFRYGGEELAVIMPETNVERALPVCEKIRGIIEKNNFEFNGQAISATVSMGVVLWTEGMTKLKLIERCDAALYKAKESGRNKVVVSEG